MKYIILLFSIASFALYAEYEPPPHELSVQLAAQTSARQGAMALGIRNHNSYTITGSVRIVSADGVDVLAPVCSFIAPPGKVTQKILPIRAVQKDRPKLVCLVLMNTPQKYIAFTRSVNCQSGAKLRDIGGNDTQDNIDLINTFSATTSSNYLLSLKSVTSPFALQLTTQPIAQWKAIARNNYIFSGIIGPPSNICAKTSFHRWNNTRGDVLWTYIYTLDRTVEHCDAPHIVLRIPADAVTESIFLARKEVYWNVTTPSAEKTGIWPALSGKAVREICITFPHDWLIISCDANWPETEWVQTEDGIFLEIRIYSRQEWQPPFPKYRSLAISVPVHLPVGVKYK